MERQYKQRRWRNARAGRRKGVVCAIAVVAVHLLFVMRNFTFPPDGNMSSTLSTVPTMVVCVAGPLLLCLGFTSRPWVISHWNAIAYTAMTPMFLSLSSACVVVMRV